MSFTGTIVLCGLGGLVLKYGGQEAKKDENTPAGFKNLTLGFIGSKQATFKERFIIVKTNFWDQVVNGGGYMFPLQGLRALFSTRAYLRDTLSNMAAYLSIWSLVSFFYFAGILPIYIAILALLGFGGLAVAYVHFLLHGNMLAMMILRMSQMNYGLEDLALRRHGREFFVQQAIQNTPPPTRLYTPKNTVYFWLNYLPWRLTVYTCWGFAIIALLLVSFVPIVGPLIFSAMISPVVSRIYFSHYLRLKKLSNRDREARFYSNFGSYVSFGFVAGQLEALPLFAGIAYCSNAIGVALMATEEMKSEDSALPTTPQVEDIVEHSVVTT